jgi:hypothetical protein
MIFIFLEGRVHFVKRVIKLRQMDICSVKGRIVNFRYTKLPRIFQNSFFDQNEMFSSDTDSSLLLLLLLLRHDERSDQPVTALDTVVTGATDVRFCWNRGHVATDGLVRW